MVYTLLQLECATHAGRRPPRRCCEQLSTKAPAAARDSPFRPFARANLGGLPAPSSVAPRASGFQFGPICQSALDARRLTSLSKATPGRAATPRAHHGGGVRGREADVAGKSIAQVPSLSACCTGARSWPGPSRGEKQASRLSSAEATAPSVRRLLRRRPAAQANTTASGHGRVSSDMKLAKAPAALHLDHPPIRQVLERG